MIITHGRKSIVNVVARASRRVQSRLRLAKAISSAVDTPV